MPNELIGNIPYPSASDPPDGPAQMQALAVASAKAGVMKFATATGGSTSRSTLVPSPVEGMLSYLQDVDRYEYYNGTQWVELSGGYNSLAKPRSVRILGTDGGQGFSTSSYLSIAGLTLSGVVKKYASSVFEVYMSVGCYNTTASPTPNTFFIGANFTGAATSFVEVAVNRVSGNNHYTTVSGFRTTGTLAAGTYAVQGQARINPSDGSRQVNVDSYTLLHMRVEEIQA